ncbi:MAG: proline dehydrogenase family protein [Tunicatimonas sp.]
MNPNPTLPARVSFDNTEVAFSYKSDQDLRKSYWLFSAIGAPWLTDVGTKLVKFALKIKLPIKGALKITIFEQFCGGETIRDCAPTIERLAQYGVKTILDYSVEGEKSEDGFEQATREILRTIEAARQAEHLPFCVFKVSGVANVRLLAKIQADQPLTSSEQAAYERARQRVDRLCGAAAEAGARILIDGEESWIQNVIDALADEMMQRYNQERAVVYNTYQFYRHQMLANLKKAFQRAATYNYFLGAKLVRGAYMEKERERAEERDYPDPIQPSKEATDTDYNAALLYCINNKQRISLVCGSHNAYSNQYLTLLMEKHGLSPNDPRVYFAQLYGMSDHISFNLAAAGYNVAKYVPYGPVKKVMPYLFRRAEENTSVAGQSSRESEMIGQELRRRKAETNN